MILQEQETQHVYYTAWNELEIVGVHLNRKIYCMIQMDIMHFRLGDLCIV